MAQPSLHYNIRVFSDIMGFYMNVGILKQAFFREFSIESILEFHQSNARGF